MLAKLRDAALLRDEVVEAARLCWWHRAVLHRQTNRRRCSAGRRLARASPAIAPRRLPGIQRLAAASVSDIAGKADAEASIGQTLSEASARRRASISVAAFASRKRRQARSGSEDYALDDYVGSIPRKTAWAVTCVPRTILGRSSIPRAAPRRPAVLPARRTRTRPAALGGAAGAAPRRPRGEPRHQRRCSEHLRLLQYRGTWTCSSGTKRRATRVPALLKAFDSGFGSRCRTSCSTAAARVSDNNPEDSSVGSSVEPRRRGIPDTAAVQPLVARPPLPLRLTAERCGTRWRRRAPRARRLCSSSSWWFTARTQPADGFLDRLFST